MEPYPDLVDDLADQMDADEQAPYTLVGSMPLVRVRELIETHFAWTAAEAHPYAEIQDNLIDATMLPIDLLRCKLSFFGATKFDPRSNRWVRISLFQDAPFPNELCASPTRAEEADAVRYSLAEIEALSRKAARGGGFDWGLADEAGKAARWLASVGMPGPQVLSRLLKRNDGKSFETLCPIETADTWHARSGELCPLIAGASLVDRAEQLTTPQGVRLGKVALPMLILPFVARAAGRTNCDIEVSWPGVRIVFRRASIDIEAENGALATELVDGVSVRAAQSTADHTVAVSNASRAVDKESWAALTRMAHRTLVPASEASRAGAG